MFAKIRNFLGKFLPKAFGTLFFLATFFFFGSFDALAADYYHSDGTLLKGYGPEVFVLEDRIRRHILSPEVFAGLNYDWKRIIQVDDSVLRRYPLGDGVSDVSRFPEGSLLKGSDPKVYIVKSGKRCWIPDAETFNNLGLRWENIIFIPDEKLAKISESKSLGAQKSPIRYPETIIVGNPDNILEDDNITFEFSGKTEIGEPSSLTFETFLEGYEKNWKSGWSQKRTFGLPQKSAFYTLFVRAKDKNGNYDPTPVIFPFAVKISSYFEKIRIESGNIKKSKPEEEFLSIYNSSNETINIAGWHFVAKKDDAAYSIFDGYDNAGLGYQGDFNIIAGSRVYIFTGKTPINWKSLRLNKCTGYFNNNFKFSLSLPKNCPKLSDDDLMNFSLSFKCQEFIKNLALCEEPENLKIFKLETECQNFIREKVNYSSCVERHRSEVDFLEKIWHVYLGKTSQIWNDSKDTITLRDKDGLKVAEYSY